MDDLLYAGAAEQARRVAAGDVSSRELVAATLDRIASVDPQLNSYRVVFGERALAEADQADARRKAGDESRPLLGVPVAIKDDVDVLGEATAWGTAAHAGPVTADAEVVRRLRAAGAVIVGKTLVPEMTMLPATDTTTFGATRNPWDLSRTPGGSSGGTGAAVAAGLCGVGLGSDGAGSIRGPACWCGVFGLKPTRDLVPLAPHEDAWQGLSVNGPLARHVADAALFLDATTGVGGHAEAAARPPGRLNIAVTSKPPPGAIARIGREERKAVQDTVALLRQLGHDVVHRDPDYHPATWPSLNVRVLRGIHDDVREAMPHPERLETRTRRVAKLGGQIPEATVRKLRRLEAEQSARLGTLFADHDVLLTPAATDGPYRAGQVGRWGTNLFLLRAAERIVFFGTWNVTGQPAASVPAGFDDDGLPLAVQLIGPQRSEPTLLSLAAQIEAERPWADRRPSLT